jgi:hypothetical protein
MNLYTIGTNFYEGYIHYIYVSSSINVMEDELATAFYKIIHIKSGTTHVSLNGKDFILIGANVLYINDRDVIKFNEYLENSINIFIFKPSVINSKFSLETCNSEITTSVTEMQD